MSKWPSRLLPAFLLAAFLSTGPAVSPLAARQTIKLTTLAPKGSSFEQSLLRMGQQWRKLSNGKIRLIVYPGGIQGGEAAMVERMGIGQTQAGLLTAVGLAQIEPAVTGLQYMPLVFKNLDELDYVSERLQPMLEKRLEAKGFKVLFWVDAGFVRFFTKTPATSPADFKKLKLFTWSGSPKQTAIMKNAGFNVVPLETGDILTGLQTGLIDAAPMPPFYALAGQIFKPAPNMLNLNWAPLIGACVITKQAWDRIPADLRPKFLEIAKKTGKDIKAEGRRESDEAVATMVKQWGLKVHTPTAAEMKQWHAVVDKAYPKIRGGMVPADIFDKVMSLVKEYRQSHGDSQ